jgi:hypothetical protein
MTLNATTINTELLEAIASEAIKSLENSTRTDAKRWQSAIRKATNELQSNPFWNYDGKDVVIMSETSNAIYTPNGVCQCKAFAQGQPCRHRAMHRLLTRYAQTA